MSRFSVAAQGQIYRDGTTTVTLGFDRSTSMGQLLWRLVAVAFLLGTIVAVSVPGGLAGGGELSGGLVVVMILSGALVLWSLVAYVQGMRQASRDWAILTEFIESALATLPA